MIYYLGISGPTYQIYIFLNHLVVSRNSPLVLLQDNNIVKMSLQSLLIFTGCSLW